MTSKKLGAILRSVPPATAVPLQADDSAPSAASPIRSSDELQRSSSPAAQPLNNAEVPLQVLIPAHVRRDLAIMAAEEGVSLRTLVLRAIRGIGLTISDTEIRGKRGRRNS